MSWSRCNRQVFRDGQTAEHLALLRHVANAHARPLMDRQSTNVPAADANLSGLSLGASRDKFKQRGLSHAVAAYDGDGLTGTDRQAEALDDRGRTPAAREVDHFKHPSPRFRIAIGRNPPDTPRARPAKPSRRLVGRP